MLAFKKDKKENEPILYQEYLERQKEQGEDSAEEEKDAVQDNGNGKAKRRILILLPYLTVAAAALILGGKIVMDAGKTSVEHSTYESDIIASSMPDAQRLDVGQLTMQTTSDRTDRSLIQEAAETEDMQEQDPAAGQTEETGQEGTQSDGLDGLVGKDGLDGEDGEDGRDGADGRDGKDGEDGADGLDGRDGKDGEAGRNGKNGADGKDGINGLDGKDGEDGKGAYQLAVEKGYTGTEEEFMEMLSTIDVNLDNMQTTIDDTTETVGTLSDTIANLNEQVSDCFQLVSDGKGLLASTLTDKGVDTAADATFGTINNNILDLYTKAFAAGADSVSGANADVVYEYHYHESSCYYTCPGTLKHYDTVEHKNGVKEKYFRCDRCGRTWISTDKNDYADRPCGVKTVTCGMVDGQILSATVVFG